jgi:hypothetical protein
VRTPVLLACFPWMVACGVDLDLSEERFACGAGGSCDPNEEPLNFDEEEDSGVIEAPLCPAVVGRWIELDPIAAPNRAGHGAAIDGENMLVFGGGGRLRPETLSVAINTTDPPFSMVSSGSAGPYGRDQHSVVLDPIDHRLYVFGGLHDDVGASNTLWTLSLNTPIVWTETAITPAPVARWGHVALLDPKRHEMLALFGEQRLDILQDVWVLSMDTSVWSPLARSDFGPSARADHAAAFIGPDRVLVYGGRSISGALDESWIFDRAANTWTAVDFGIGPGRRYGHTMVFDPEGYRVIVYGGRRDDTMAREDAWVLSLAKGCWSKVDTVGARPNARAEHTAVLHGRSMIVYGGEDGSELDDLWALDLD